MTKWLVAVNPLKSAVIVFFTSRMDYHPVCITINGETIKQTTCHRHLGLQLDESLSWSPHVDYVCKKLSQRIGLLHRFRRQLSSPTIRDIYVATAMPVADYACVVGGPGIKKSDCEKLERVHRRAARLISGTKLADRVSHKLLLARAGFPALSAHRLHRLAWFAYKLSSGFVPDHLLTSTEHWLTPPPERSRTLRNTAVFRLPMPKKAVLSRSPVYAALSLWNSLPNSLRSSSHSRLTQHFLS